MTQCGGRFVAFQARALLGDAFNLKAEFDGFEAVRQAGTFGRGRQWWVA